MNIHQTRLYCPVSFKRELLPPEYRRDRWFFNVAYLMDCIIRRRIFYKKEDPDGWVKLNAKMMMEVLRPGDWATTKRLAIDCGLVECWQKYIKGKESRKYRLAPPHDIADWTTVTTTSKKFVHLAKKTKAIREGPHEQVDHHLKRYLQELDILDIDEGELERWVIERTDDGESPQHIKFMVHEHWREVRERQWRYPLPDEFGKRRHTNLCSMPSVLRELLRWKGNPLAGVDIKNSQMITLAMSCREYLEIESDSSPSIPYQYGLHLPPDFLYFLESVQDGKLYEFLQERAGLDDDLPRDELKELVFEVVFGRNLNPTVILDVLQREFPAVYNHIRSVKHLGTTRKEVEDHYKDLVQRMQRKESFIMFDCVCRRLMVEHPNIPVWTIHDSVLTIPEHLSTVSSVVRDEFRKVGIRVTLEEVNYGAVGETSTEKILEIATQAWVSAGTAMAATVGNP